MKEQVQEAGVRKWFGDDFINMQTEITAAEIAVFEDFNTNCILSGVKVTANGGNWDVSAGLVYLLDATGANGKICRVDAETNITLPIYYEQETLDKDDNADYGRVYKSAVSKDIINEFHAKNLAAAPGHSEYITLTSTDSGNVRFKDVLTTFLQTNVVSSTLKIGLTQLATGAEAQTMSSSNGNAISPSSLRQVLSNLITEKVDIDDWNMDSALSVSVAHGLSATEWKTIRALNVIIRNDTDTFRYKIETMSVAGVMQGVVSSIDATNINLARLAGGFFDNANFDSTSYNRGFVTFDYIPD